MRSETFGVSVAICCHNSAARLPETLRHLAAQRCDPGLAWEVVVVDNASKDGTAAIAEANWPAGAPARLRVATEPRAGLQFARERAYEATCYPIVSFIDDDNWVCPDWVALVAEVMAARPGVAACGGVSGAACEIPKPSWFPQFAHAYAVGAQGLPDGDTAGSRPLLWGAGLSVRRSAVEGLHRAGFRQLAVGRQGGKLSAGEDSELCLALRLAGWELWFDPRLRLDHFIPAGRLQWRYLRGLMRGFGATLLDPYWFELDPRQRALPAWRRSWLMLVAREVRGLPRLFPGWWRSWGRWGEGDPRVLATDQARGRWGALLRVAGGFGKRCRDIRDAAWRKAGPGG